MTAWAPTQDIEELVERALELDSHAVAQLVSLFQDRRPGAAHQRAEVIEQLDERQAGSAREGTVLGITGTPGSGKSSLIGRIVVDLLARDRGLSLAVLAIDPSSHVSGGALLGDRTRLKAPDTDHRLFFRSEASDTELGGLSPSSFQVCRLLVRLFDAVVVETVGIGQSEADIRHLADHVFLVISPLSGDSIQFMKAGIVEIPDSFVLNKSDQPTAEASYRQLASTLWLARPFDADDLAIHRTSVRTGQGLDELGAAIRALVEAGPTASLAEREPHFLERWVRDAWGRAGMAHLRSELGGAPALLERSGDFDEAQAAFDQSIREQLSPG